MSETASDPVRKPDRSSVLVDFALQGGGAHGAFTWGVLDRLLEEPWLEDRRYLRHVGRRDERRCAGRRLCGKRCGRSATSTSRAIGGTSPKQPSSTRSGVLLWIS